MWLKKRFLAPGPTPLPEESRLSQSRSQIYHRTREFAATIRAVTGGIQRLLEVDWPVVPIAASGTGGMQMAVSNSVEPGEKALVVDAGKFGRRWSRMLDQLGVEVVELRVDRGKAVAPGEFRKKLKQHPGLSAVFLTMVETSTLTRQPVEELGEILAGRGLTFVLDAISALGAEPVCPGEYGADLVVAGAQKGLMGPPGLAFLAASPAAVKRAEALDNPDRYFDLPLAVKRLRTESQTPWTPPMGLLEAQAKSLEQLFDLGKQAVYSRHRRLATACREALREADLKIFSERPAVAGTPVKFPEEVDAEKLHDYIHKNCKLYIPGGRRELADKILRIGHLGHVDYFDLLNGLAALELGLRAQGCDLSPGDIVGPAQARAEAVLTDEKKK